MMLFNTHTTGIHYTDEIVEWAVLRKTRAGIEKLREGTHPIPEGFFEREDVPLFPAEVLGESHKNFRGVVTVSLPSSRLLMRVLELPSVDLDELTGMVELQADQIFPFPLDQLTVSYEVLHQTEDHSRVLVVAAQRKVVDQLGDLFKEQRVYIRSLDAEILVWWSLLTTNREIPREGRVLLILEGHTEFSIVVVDDGVPISFRSLELFHDFTDPSVAAEIVEEIRYTLLSLEAGYGHNADCQTEIWSESEIPEALVKQLGDLSPRGINLHDLGTLPALSEGLALRSADRTRHHAELVLREWVELQRRRQIMKIATITSIAALSVWMAVVSITGTVFAIQKASANRVRNEAAKYAAPARAAQEARAEKESLEKYADRSHSALECLLEATETLPASLEISSFSYSKGKAVRLRGSGATSDPAYVYFQKLGSSALFKSIKDDRVSPQTRQGKRIQAFSVTAVLPPLATEEDLP